MATMRSIAGNRASSPGRIEQRLAGPVVPEVGIAAVLAVVTGDPRQRPRVAMRGAEVLPGDRRERDADQGGSGEDTQTRPTGELRPQRLRLPSYITRLLAYSVPDVPKVSTRPAARRSNATPELHSGQ
jgi:hypothetical protein